MNEQNNNSVRDNFARDRTLLANERTFLAYLRTAIMLLASGITFIELIGSEIFFTYLGCILILISIFTTIFGYRRFVKMKFRINKVSDSHSD